VTSRASGPSAPADPADACADRTDLSVVMPAYNEESSIDLAIGEVLREVLDAVASAELIVVDDGSRDATAERVRAWTARDPRIRVVQRANGGHGAALMTGLAAARGRRCLLVDADAQVDLAGFRASWDAVVGIDAVLGVRSRRRDPMHRIVLTRCVRVLLRARYRVPFADANVPYKLVDRVWCDRLLAAAPASPAVPSILLALLLARSGASVVEQVVVHRARGGGAGSLAPLRLIRLCLRAWREIEDFARRLPPREA
jgi:dolichol-phosphate mannosyltransferase